MAVRNKIDQYFTVKNYETDFRQSLKPSAMLGFFQEIAGEHSEEMGLGFENLREQGLFWVLSKIYVEVERLPVFRDKVKAVTWPQMPNKAIYERSFLLESAEGDLLLKAFSRWCILKADCGRILPCSKIQQPELNYITEKSVAFDDWHMPSVTDKTQASFSLKIANSEYDLNNHVNNIKYADYVFNCFAVEELRSRRLKSFQIHYVRQSHENDVLDFYREEVNPGEYVIEGVKNGDETVVSAKVRFE